jgi:electron transport complex protein RnfA
MEKLYMLLTAFLSIVLVNNLFFTKFLGTCPCIGLGRLDSALALGVGVTIVTTVSGILTWMIDTWILMPLNLQVARFICYIIIIATVIWLAEIYARKSLPEKYKNLGISISLMNTNCVILGLCLFLNAWGTNNLPEAAVISFGAGIGYTIALCILTSVSETLLLADVPKCFKGAPITLITAGLIALALQGFVGLFS